MKKSRRRMNWAPAIGMAVNARDGRRTKGETSRMQRGKRMLYIFPGRINRFVGPNKCVVEWGEKGGPKKEAAGEKSVVLDYWNNLVPRVSKDGHEHLSFQGDRRRNPAKKDT